MAVPLEDTANEEEVEAVVQALLKAHMEHCYDSPECDESSFSLPIAKVNGICDTCGIVFFEGPELVDNGDA